MMSFLTALFKLTTISVFASLIAVSILAYYPVLDLNPVVYKLPTLPAFDGPLADNDLLSKATKLYVGQLAGAESIVEHKGEHIQLIKTCL